MNKAATISNSDEDFNNDTKIPFIDEQNYNNFKIAKIRTNYERRCMEKYEKAKLLNTSEEENK